MADARGNAWELLLGLAPFARMAGPDLRAAWRLAAPLSMRRDKALFYQGDRAERCFLLASGSVRSVMYRADETRIELGRSLRGEWLGLEEALLDARYLCDAVAEDSCELLAFDRGSLQRLLAIGGMRHALLHEMARRYCVMHARVELNTPLDRLARFLLERCSVGAEVRCTQEEIAEAIGVTRETVNRHLGELQQRGLVRVGRGAVAVVDAQRLQELAR